MAIWRHTLGQSAVKAASERVAAELGAGLIKDQDEADERFDEVYESVFKTLDALADKDDESYEKTGGSKSSGGTSKRGSSRSSKTGGGRSKGRSGGGKSSVTLDDALEMELNFGAFEGLTLAAVLELSADECDEDYGYGDGERDGTDYISWLASDKNKNEFVQRRARLIADEEGIDY